MRRTMFEAGFNSPTSSYTPHQMGSLWSDVKDIFRGVKSGTTPPPPPPPPPQPTGTVFGIPTSYVVIGGAVALTLGIVAAVVGSRKSGPPPVPPKPSVGRRRR
jgi:hypothetical protein